MWFNLRHFERRLLNEKYNISKVLYHASPIQGLKVITPKNNTSHDNGKIKRIYATNDIQYATTFTFPSDNSFCEIYKKGKSPWTIKMNEKYKHLLLKPCSIYEVSSEGFKKVAYSEYVKTSPAPVLKEEKFKTALECMKKYGAVVNLIKNKDKHFKGINL